MKVEKVPDSTFDMIGGLDKQIREIKEVSMPKVKKVHLSGLIFARSTSLPSSPAFDTRSTSPLFCLLQVIELPIKHPELFESLGVAQPKVSGTECIQSSKRLLLLP